MKPATFLAVTLIILSSSALSFSNTALSPNEMSLVKVMKDKGVFLENVNVEEITPEEMKFYQDTLKEYGTDDTRSWKPNPKFSSPEKTWATYKGALMRGDIEAAMECHVPGGDKEYREIFEILGMDELKEIARDMRPVERVRSDESREKYKTLRNENGVDITYWVDFVNINGEWKILEY